MRRALRALSSVLIVAGVLLLADAALTLAWQEPVSAIYSRITQERLSGELEDLEVTAPAAPLRRALARQESGAERMALLARALKAKAGEGQAIGRIDIGRVGVDRVVVQGTEAASLRKGPGHYPDTPLPGMRGTVAIAGHRTTYGAPFRRVNELKRGDPIMVTMPYGRFTYRVERQRIVPPTAVWVTQRVSFDRLVLSACHPLYSAAKRIIVFARLARAEPRGAAVGGGEPTGA